MLSEAEKIPGSLLPSQTKKNLRNVTFPTFRYFVVGGSDGMDDPDNKTKAAQTGLKAGGHAHRPAVVVPVYDGPNLLEALPIELLSMIVGWIPARQLMPVFSVSRMCWKAALDDAVWKRRCACDLQLEQENPSEKS